MVQKSEMVGGCWWKDCHSVLACSPNVMRLECELRSPRLPDRAKVLCLGSCHHQGSPPSFLLLQVGSFGKGGMPEQPVSSFTKVRLKPNGVSFRASSQY